MTSRASICTPLILASLTDLLYGYRQWGDASDFPLYKPETADSVLQLDYLIKSTEIQHPGLLCTKPRRPECANSFLKAMDVFETERGRISIVGIVNRLQLQDDARSCVSSLLWRLFRQVYISESSLEWLVGLNNAENEITRTEFWTLFDGKPVLGLPILNGAYTQLKVPIRPQTITSFEAKKCDIHLWYSEIIMSFAGKPISTMKLSVVPNTYLGMLPRSAETPLETVLAPPREVVLKVLATERKRIHEGTNLVYNPPLPRRPWKPAPHYMDTVIAPAPKRRLYYAPTANSAFTNRRDQNTGPDDNIDEASSDDETNIFVENIVELE